MNATGRLALRLLGFRITHTNTETHISKVKPERIYVSRSGYVDCPRWAIRVFGKNLPEDLAHKISEKP